MTTTQTDTTLTLKRTFKAKPEEVFDAFASVEAMKQWFGPGSCQVLEGEMDFREGGAYSLKISTDGDDVGLSGTFQCIECPAKLAYTWAWSGVCRGEQQDGHVSTVTVTLSKVEGGTELTLLHEGLESTASRDDHQQGWTGSFDKMEKSFSV